MTDCCAEEHGSSERPGLPSRALSTTGFRQDEALAFWRGMRDDPKTLRVSLFASWMKDLFEIEPKPPIADPRLESIRRLTVALRHGPSRESESELWRARDAGVSEQQIAAIRFRLPAFSTLHQEVA